MTTLMQTPCRLPALQAACLNSSTKAKGSHFELMQVKVEYDLDALVPDAPSEPWHHEHVHPRQTAVPRIPLFSTSFDEAAEQSERMQEAGLVLPEHLHS